MPDTYFAIQTMGFATGSALFALLIALSWKGSRVTGRRSSGIAAAALGLLWNAGSLLMQLVLLMGGSSQQIGFRLANAFAWSAPAILPTVLLLLLRPGHWQTKRGQMASRWLLWVSVVNAAWLTLGFLIAAMKANPAAFNSFMRLAAYNLVFHLVAGTLLYRGEGHSSRAARVYSLALTLLGGGMAISLLVLIHWDVPRPIFITLAVLTQQSPILMAIATFAFLARLRFSDVFVKRSLTILAAVAISLVHTEWVVFPSMLAIRNTARYPEAGAWIVATVLWVALLLLFPRCQREIYRAVDRWLFRRPDYKELAQSFSRESESAASEAELFTRIEHLVRDSLGVAATKVLPVDEASVTPDEINRGANDVILLHSRHAARGLLAESETEGEVEMMVPVRTGSEVSHLLLVAPGAEGRKLLSDELTFLLTLAGHAGRRIEALKFERERHEQHLRETNLQRLVTEADLRALRAQINPHFLFNTLNTIADLISSEPDKAEAMTERLAEVFRYVLVRGSDSLITVSQEFDFLRTYLEIEQARFGDRLRVEMTLDPAVASVPVPTFILQPLVENAVKHGLSAKRGGGTLRVEAQSEGEFLRLIVEDDGAGWRAGSNGLSSVGPGGIGLENVSQRLQVLYAGRAALTVHSEVDRGTRISITIPKDEDQNSDRGRRSFSAIALAEAPRRAS